MTPVYQSRLDSGERIGDCFRACLATILDMEATNVPHFYAGLKPGEQVPEITRYDMCMWFRGKGLSLIQIGMEGIDPTDVMETVSANHPGLHYILSGKGVKGADHSVVCRDGKMVHDPSRLQYGLSGPTSDGYFHVHFIGKAV